MIKENIKLPPRNRSGRHHGSIGNLHTFLQSHRQTTCCSYRQTPALVIDTSMSPLLDLVIFNCSPSAITFIGNSSVD